MANGILSTLKYVAIAFLLAGVCLVMLCLFAYAQDAPENWVAAVGRTSLLFGALMAGFLGGRGGKHFLAGLICTALYLLVILLCSAFFPATSTAVVEKWVFLGIALACGLVGSLIGGGRRRTKVVRRKKHKARRTA